MKCYHCGTEVPEEGAIFCPACGADMINTKEGETTVLNMDTLNAMYNQQTNANAQSVPDTQPLNYNSAPQYADPYAAPQYADTTNLNQPAAPVYPTYPQQPEYQQPVSGQPKAPKKKKGKIILISILIFLIVAIGTAAALFFTSPAYKFSGKIKDGDYAEAVKIYNDKVNDKSLQESIAKMLVKDKASKVINDAFAKYQSGQFDINTYYSIVAVFVDLDLANPPATTPNTPAVPNTPVIPEIPTDIPAYGGDMDEGFYDDPTYYDDFDEDYFDDFDEEYEMSGLESFIMDYSYDYECDIEDEFEDYTGESAYCLISSDINGYVTVYINPYDWSLDISDDEVSDLLETFAYFSLEIDDLYDDLDMYSSFTGLEVQFDIGNGTCYCFSIL